MKTDKKRLMKEVAEQLTASGMEMEDKLWTLGPLLSLCNRNLTEDEFKLWLDIYGITTVDPVMERLVKDYLNLLHYSGFITIGDRSVETWLDVDSEYALQGVTDEKLASFISEIEIDIAGMEAYIG